jgi:ElaB/YqjD/DUF883 family membrane-anchored ribosome-binding protein
MKPSPHPAPLLKQEAHELISDITQLMAEAEEMLSESTSHHAEEKVALLMPAHVHGSERLMDRYISGKAKLASIARRTDETIRACPYEALLVALGVGVVLGATFRRRARHLEQE